MTDRPDVVIDGEKVAADGASSLRDGLEVEIVTEGR